MLVSCAVFQIKMKNDTCVKKVGKNRQEDILFLPTMGIREILIFEKLDI